MDNRHRDVMPLDAQLPGTPEEHLDVVEVQRPEICPRTRIHVRSLYSRESDRESMQLRQFALEGGGFSPDRVATGLRTTKVEIAGTLGLANDALSRASRVNAPKTQMRLRQMLEILRRVEAEVGSDLVAYAWFRSEPLPGFAGMRPCQLVKEGKADMVHAYLDDVLAGGYA